MTVGLVTDGLVTASTHGCCLVPIVNRVAVFYLSISTKNHTKKVDLVLLPKMFIKHSFPSCFLLLLIFVNYTSGLFEDQIGKFDW